MFRAVASFTRLTPGKKESDHPSTTSSAKNKNTQAEKKVFGQFGPSGQIVKFFVGKKLFAKYFKKKRPCKK